MANESVEDDASTQPNFVTFQNFFERKMKQDFWLGEVSAEDSRVGRKEDVE